MAPSAREVPISQSSQKLPSVLESRPWIEAAAKLKMPNTNTDTTGAMVISLRQCLLQVGVPASQAAHPTLQARLRRYLQTQGYTSSRPPTATTRPRWIPPVVICIPKSRKRSISQALIQIHSQTEGVTLDSAVTAPSDNDDDDDAAGSVFSELTKTSWYHVEDYLVQRGGECGPFLPSVNGMAVADDRSAVLMQRMEFYWLQLLEDMKERRIQWQEEEQNRHPKHSPEDPTIHAWRKDLQRQQEYRKKYLALQHTDLRDKLEARLSWDPSTGNDRIADWNSTLEQHQLEWEHTKTCDPKDEHRFEYSMADMVMRLVLWLKQDPQTCRQELEDWKRTMLLVDENGALGNPNWTEDIRWNATQRILLFSLNIICQATFGELDKILCVSDVA